MPQFDLERTEENLAAYGAPARGWFPRLRLAALVECCTLAVIETPGDSIGVGEPAEDSRHDDLLRRLRGAQ
jgi:hypothetical protein